MKLHRTITAAAILCAAFLATGPAAAEKAPSPTAALDATIAQRTAELRQLRAQKKEASAAARAGKKAERIAKAEKALERARAAK